MHGPLLPAWSNELGRFKGAQCCGLWEKQGQAAKHQIIRTSAMAIWLGRVSEIQWTPKWANIRSAGQARHVKGQNFVDSLYPVHKEAMSAYSIPDIREFL